jgi:hypothetical protein
LGFVLISTSLILAFSTFSFTTISAHVCHWASFFSSGFLTVRFLPWVGLRLSHFNQELSGPRI